MNNYIKTLPVTGGTGLGLGLTMPQQIVILGIIFLATTFVAYAIHYRFRAGKNIGE